MASKQNSKKTQTKSKSKVKKSPVVDEGTTKKGSKPKEAKKAEPKRKTVQPTEKTSSNFYVKLNAVLIVLIKSSLHFLFIVFIC